MKICQVSLISPMQNSHPKGNSILRAPVYSGVMFSATYNLPQKFSDPVSYQFFFFFFLRNWKCRYPKARPSKVSLATHILEYFAGGAEKACMFKFSSLSSAGKCDLPDEGAMSKPCSYLVGENPYTPD